jgi:hypothetical protein
VAVEAFSQSGCIHDLEAISSKTRHRARYRLGCRFRHPVCSDSPRVSGHSASMVGAGTSRMGRSVVVAVLRAAQRHDPAFVPCSVVGSCPSGVARRCLCDRLRHGAQRGRLAVAALRDLPVALEQACLLGVQSLRLRCTRVLHMGCPLPPNVRSVGRGADPRRAQGNSLPPAALRGRRTVPMGAASAVLQRAGVDLDKPRPHH